MGYAQLGWARRGFYVPSGPKDGLPSPTQTLKQCKTAVTPRTSLKNQIRQKKLIEPKLCPQEEEIWACKPGLRQAMNKPETCWDMPG